MARREAERNLAERLEQIKKMVNWAEINRSPEHFIRIRRAIDALSHKPMIQEYMYKEKKMTELEKVFFLIADALALPDPHPAIIYAARYLLTEYDRRALPDWVEALANASDAVWGDVVDEVRRLKAAEEMEE